MATSWLPCSEVKGEGILLVFDNDVINNWCDSDSIKRRINLLSENYRRNMRDFDPNLTDEDISEVSPRRNLRNVLIR